MAWFNKGPQYFPGVAPARLNPANSKWRAMFVRDPKTVTSGFYEDELHEFSLSYGLRAQPDRGGALNYAYENYGLPLNDVAGPWMVAAKPWQPLGSPPLTFYQMAPITGIGGLVPGQVISQPLLDPNNPASGYDIYS